MIRFSSVSSAPRGGRLCSVPLSIGAHVVWFRLVGGHQLALGTAQGVSAVLGHVRQCSDIWWHFRGYIKYAIWPHIFISRWLRFALNLRIQWVELVWLFLRQYLFWFLFSGCTVPRAGLGLPLETRNGLVSAVNARQYTERGPRDFLRHEAE